MSLRTFGMLQIQNVGIAQPLIGSWIQAGNILTPQASPVVLTLGGAAAGDKNTDAQVLFKAQDQVWLVDAGGGNAEPAIISSVNGAANQVTLGPQTTQVGSSFPNPVTTLTHKVGIFGVGTWILLKLSVNTVYVQMEDGTSGTYAYFGDSPLMTSTFHRFKKLAKVASAAQPNDMLITEYGGLNSIDISSLWVLGGASVAADGYTPSVLVI